MMGDRREEKPPLPYGWVVKISKSYPDRVYYFNINSGASTWEFPDLIKDYICGSSGPVSPPILSATSLHPGDTASSVLVKHHPVDATFSPEFSDTENSSSRGSSTTHGSPMKLLKILSNFTRHTPAVDSGNCRRLSGPDGTALFHQGNSGTFSVSKNLVIPLSISTNTSTCTTTKILKSPNGLFPRSSNSNRVRFSNDNIVQENVSSVSQNIPKTCVNSKVVVCSHSSLVMTPRSSVASTPVVSTPHVAQTKLCTRLTTNTSSEKSGFPKSRIMDAQPGTKPTPHGTKSGLQAGGYGASKPDYRSLPKHSGANKPDSGSVKQSDSLHDKQHKLSRYTVEEIKQLNHELPKQGQGKTEITKKHLSTSHLTKQTSVANTLTLQSEKDSKATTSKRKFSSESHNDSKSVGPNQSSTDKIKKSTNILNPVTANVGSKDKHSTASIDRRKSYNENCNNNNNKNNINSDGKDNDTTRGRVKRKSSEIMRPYNKQVNVSGTRASTDDQRKVIKALHSATKSRNVIVKNEPLKRKPSKGAVGDELVVCAKVDTAEVNEPLTKKRKHFNFSNTSNGNVSDDRASPTFDKPFIGDMGKLLSIQSWIDKIDEHAGSDSPSQVYYNETLLGKSVDKRVVNYECGNSGTSGYSSMTRVSSPPPSFMKRGWPGQRKETNMCTREVTEMEVDDIELPEGNVICQQEEDMVIDGVLTEVREQMKTCPDKVVGALTASITESAPPTLDNASSVHTLQHIYVVIDTNILISELSFLEDLKDHDVQGYGKPVLYIPWIVLQELDSLKDRTKPGIPLSLSLSTQHKARNAVRFLKTYFVSKHPRVVGQTPKQSQEAVKLFKSTCNDDIILQACLQCQKNRAGSEVMLLTNDNNLINKSLVSGVSAHNKTDLMSALKRLKGRPPPSAISPTVPKTEHTTITPSHPTPSTSHSNTTSSNQRAGYTTTTTATNTVVTPVAKSTAARIYTDTPVTSKTKQSYPPDVSNIPLPRTPAVASIPLPETLAVASIPLPPTPVPASHPHSPQTPVCRYTLDQLLDDVYCKMKKVLREALGKVLETEMELVFTDIWLEIVHRKPPWSLKDILESINKHWIAVFGHVYKRCLKYNVERLLKCFIDVKVPSVENLANAAFDALELLQESVKRNKYGQPMVHIRDCVHCLHELCVNIRNNNKTVDSIASLEAYLQQQLAPEKLTGCDNTVKPVEPVQPPLPAQSTTQEVHPQTGSRVVPQQTFTPAPETGDQSMLGTGILAAGRLQKVWQHVFKCCDELQNVVNNGERSPGTLGQIEALLTLLVPVLKDIRVHYNSVLQLPMEELPNHAQLFIQFTALCNNFFPSIQMPDDIAPVPAEDFLALFSSPEQRTALNQFLAELDEMIHHIYTCIHILDPGDS